jgi:hypothetical protein
LQVKTLRAAFLLRKAGYSDGYLPGTTNFYKEMYARGQVLTSGMHFFVKIMSFEFFTGGYKTWTTNNCRTKISYSRSQIISLRTSSKQQPISTVTYQTLKELNIFKFR